VKLNLEKNSLKEIEREKIILSEIYWITELKSAAKLGNSIDTPKNYFENSLDTLLNLTEYFNLKDTSNINIVAVHNKLDMFIRNLCTTYSNTTIAESLKQKQIDFHLNRLNHYQTKLHQIIIKLRAYEWSPKADVILKKITKFNGFFLLFLIILTPFMSPLLVYYRGRKPLTKWLLYLITLWFLIFMLFIVMRSSERIKELNPNYINPLSNLLNQRISTTLLLGMIILFFPFLIDIFLKKKYLRFAGVILQWLSYLTAIYLSFRIVLNKSFWSFRDFPLVMLAVSTYILIFNYFYRKLNFSRTARQIYRLFGYVLFIITFLVMLVGILVGLRIDISGKFNLNGATNMIIAEQSNLLIFGLELTIAIMFLILVLNYSVFPTLVNSTILLPKEAQKVTDCEMYFTEVNSTSFLPNLGRIILNDLCKTVTHFGKYHCWGWNRHYNYYIEGILTESGIQITLGLLGSIIMLLIPFLFSSAAYYSSSFLFSSYLFNYPSGHLPLNSFIPFLIIILTLWILYPFKSNRVVEMIINYSSIFFLLPIIYLLFKFYYNPSNVIILIYLITTIIIWFWFLAYNFDSGKRHWIAFLILSIPLIYFILINFVIFPEKIQLSQIIPRIISRLLRIQSSPISFAELIISISSVIPLFLLWISPILIGLEALDSKFSAQTLRILRWVIQHLRKHTIIFGYGDLGKKVGEGIVRRIVIPAGKSKKEKVKEQFNFVEILSTRRQEFVDLCTDFIVVDKNSGVFDETHPDPDYGTFGICDIENGDEHQSSKEKSVVLLGLVGDCKDPAIHDDTNLEFSKITIFTGKDEEAIFPLFNEIYKHHLTTSGSAPSAIICVQKRVYGAYLEWRCVNKDIYFVYPPFLRGTILGEMTIEDMIKQRFDPEKMKNNKKKVLILGEGNQLFYILLTLQENLQKFFFGAEPINSDTNLIDRGDTTKFIESDVRIVSDEEHIEQKSVETLSKQIINRELRPAERQWLIHPLIGMLSDDAYTWNIKVYFDSPDNSLVLRSVLQELKPDIIVIASVSSTKTTTITMELLLTLEIMRRNNADYKPHVIVGSRMVEWKQIRDAIACWRAEIDDRHFYPIQEVDSVVDFYDDATNMIVNLRDALSRQCTDREDEYDGEPIEISRCATRIPYGLAEFLGTISNLKFSRGNSIRLLPTHDDINIPIFHNYRSLNMKFTDLSELIEKVKSSRIFCFTSGITPVKFKSDEIDKQSEIVRKRRHLMIVSTKRKNLKKIENVLNPLFENKQHCLPSIKTKCSICKNRCAIASTQGCPQRRLCPIDISSRHSDVLKKQKEWGKWQENNFYEHCLCNCCEEPEEKELKNEVKSKRNDYAQLSICGYGGENYGSTSRAINLLVFRDDIKRGESKADYVIDLQYDRSFGCYRPERNYYKFYGEIVKWEEERLKEIKIESFINAILIRPTTEQGFGLWRDYAISLFRLINSYPAWQNKYRLFISKPDLILLFRWNENLFRKIENTLCRHFREPDLFLYILRGYKGKNGKPIVKGICDERETSCPFEKIADESRTYRKEWSEILY